ncbi:Rrf2 family transcriptional regulator [Duganella aceris]|uniref:Rrf2 family transcriptional regulator n=1 Tax=Duganella aceris TaxID=2703883 RepID=A0ABX0FGQ8_9BURK|nr:Rrf2 family transcriptional regulator [Duganella aceris]NGZ83757.1 Rrf2 family transcriptional regulator [Duganella aceris]
MSVNNVQFAVASHILTVLAYRNGGQATSAELADSVQAHPTFVRKTITRLAKAGLLIATRGVTGACRLARAPEQISLLDIYRASEASPVFAVHSYPPQDSCVVSLNIKDGMNDVLRRASAGLEEKLASMTLRDLLDGVHQAEAKAAS